MKLIFKGKFDGNAESLPHGEHQPGAVKFKEFEDMKKFAVIMNIIAGIIIIALLILYSLRCSFIEIISDPGYFIGLIASLVVIFPHELLHAVCFKEEVYLYTYFKKGLAFVVGPEIMSKSRFVFMSLLPNIVFGFIPYIIGMISPSLVFFGIFGAFSIGMGAGDYANVFNALTQMPKGAKTYMHGFHSYWFMPE